MWFCCHCWWHNQGQTGAVKGWLVHEVAPEPLTDQSTNLHVRLVCILSNLACPPYIETKLSRHDPMAFNYFVHLRFHNLQNGEWQGSSPAKYLSLQNNTERLPMGRIIFSESAAS